jgi:hypothetical protein
MVRIIIDVAAADVAAAARAGLAAFGFAGAGAGRVVLPTGRRADLAAFFAGARSDFEAFLVPAAVLADRPAVFAECLLIAVNIASNFV